MYTFFACLTDISCPLLESDLAYSDDDVPSVYENGLYQKSFNKAKENFNFLHLNRYISLENLYIYIYIHSCVNSLKLNEIMLEKIKDAS